MGEAVGYSTDYKPNKNWEHQGLACEWEHCIENLPMPASEHNPLRCSLFGHCCPGGVERVAECSMTVEKWLQGLGLDGRP